MGIRAVRSHFKNTKRGGDLIMKKLLIFVIALMVLAAFSGLTTAATTVKGSKSNGSERVAADKASPKLMTGTVTEVNVKTNTFIVTSKGKSVTFSAAKLKALPKVDEIIDVTYTETPGGPMEATTINNSKSNNL